MLCVVLALSATCEAKKIYTANPGCVFLSTGDSIVADGNMKISDALKKKKKLELIEKPYTKQNRVRRRISPTDIDSVRIWSPSAPGHTHTLVYIPRYDGAGKPNTGPIYASTDTLRKVIIFQATAVCGSETKEKFSSLKMDGYMISELQTGR